MDELIDREKELARLEKERPARLALDFAGVEFMDSSGIGLVLGRYRLMQMCIRDRSGRACPTRARRKPS